MFSKDTYISRRQELKEARQKRRHHSFRKQQFTL